jgi:hypothetical protein
MGVQAQTTGPEPLREGTVLDERFAVGAVLGRGGFGITYLVEDIARGDRAVVNELAPIGSVRCGDDVEFMVVGPAAGQRLRHQFTSEARRLQKIRIPRVPQYRAVFHEHQTAYYATDFIEGARPLTELLGSGHGYEEARRIFDLLLETLEGVHGSGLLHQDVKPSNILLGPQGEPYLVDFGSARQWCADLTICHDLQFSADFAALEQLTERGRRTAATDLYGLAATTYTLLTGSSPTPSHLRIQGAPLIPLRSVRPDVPEPFAQAIERLLELEPEDRPQSVAELRALLSRRDEARPETDRVRDLDARRRRLQRFRHDPRQCPACGEVLAVAEPLARDVCPVCQDGRIKRRRIEEKSCPSCRGGILREVANVAPLRFCPACSLGRLLPKRRLLRQATKWQCEKCELTLTATADGASSTQLDLQWQEWRARSGRQERVMFCDACLAQFDAMPDGRWQRMTPNVLGHEWSRLYPDEWARVAAGLAPDAGNAYCESCGCDYFIADGCITLLSDPLNDPHSFASHYCGHLIPLAELPYLAVGKESGHKGLVCKSCRLEFDSQGLELLLVRSSDPRLRPHVGQAKTLRDWHRVAQDLPVVGQEAVIEEDIVHALAEAYSHGEVPFDARDPDLVWRGRAHEVHEEGTHGRSQRLVIDAETVSLGGWKRRNELVRDIVRIDQEADHLSLHLLSGEVWVLGIEPVNLAFRLDSGKDVVELGAEALANRLSAVAKGRRGKP